MNNPDDLERLWQTQPVQTDMRGEEMRQIIVKKTEAFDRKIRKRNLREYIAALFVVPVFFYFGWTMPNSIARAGSVIIAVGGLWIVYYLWRHGAGPADPLPDQTLATYRRALMAKYDHQIRLLRTVKLWYLLPLYVGMMTLLVGLLRESVARSAGTLFIEVYGVVCTLFFGFVWWLNGVWGVRKIERLRAQVISETEEGQTSS
jgi:hypothetical protein